MRPAQDVTAGQSATPIYDALYSEYRRSFRTLPGDRSGEDDLGFRPFGTPVSSGLYGHGTGYGSGSARTGAGSAGHGSGPSGAGYGSRYGTYPSAWSAQQHTPAALPPGPRRGL